MNYIDLKENVKRGESTFPLSLYTVNGEGKQILPYHWHNEFEIFHLETGNAVARIGESSYSMTSGENLFVNTGEIHSAVRNEDCTCIYNSIVFDFSMFNSFVTDDCQHIINDLSMSKILVPSRLPTSSCQHKIDNIIEEMISVLTKKSKGYEIYIKGCLYLFFSLLVESENLIENTGRKNKTENYETVIKKSMDYISKNFQNKIYLEDLAKQVQMSKFAFCKCFKQYMGISPMEYINSLRVNNAYNLLYTGRENVTSAAVQSGFDNMSYFAKTFKKYKGFSPSKVKSTH